MEDETAAEEAAEAAEAQASDDASELSKYSTAIRNLLYQSWIDLPGMKGLSCTLRVTTIPGGEVVGVEVVKSSGDATFDRQAENGVRKASPLPVPEDRRLYEQSFRRFKFVFKP